MAKEQSLRMNFWTPTFHSWGAGLDASDMPWYLLYDYVEVYDYDQEANEFRLNWRDDFESFDSLRWHKATGGFDANSSEFVPENVSVKAGNLVLKMEPAVVEKKAIHHVPIAHEDIEHNLHKEKHFDREHVRSHKDSHDEKFWKEKVIEQTEDVESSDEDADWEDYQRYLRQHRAPVEHHVEEVTAEEEGSGEEDEDSDREDYEEYRRAYKLWKDEQRQAHIEAEQIKRGHVYAPISYEQPHHYRTHYDVEVDPRHEDHDSYLSYK